MVLALCVSVGLYAASAGLPPLVEPLTEEGRQRRAALEAQLKVDREMVAARQKRLQMEMEGDEVRTPSGGGGGEGLR